MVRNDDRGAMTEGGTLAIIEDLCGRMNVPADGWTVWFFFRDGPKCFRRIEKGERTHTVYIHPDRIDMYDDIPGGKLMLIAEEALA